MTRAIDRVRTLARELGTPTVPRPDPPFHAGGCARPMEEARLGLDRTGTVLWSGR
jgi:hypothetical protein